MRRWLAGVAALVAGCHGLLGLDDVGYREPVAAGGGGAGGGETSSGGGGGLPLDGAPRWVFTFDDADAEGALQTGVDGVFDASGRAVISVLFDGTVDLQHPTPSSSGAANVLLVTLDENGSHLRHRPYGGAKAIDAQIATVGEEIFVAGTYAEPEAIDVGGQDLSAACVLELEETACMADAYAIKYDGDLDLRWRRSEGPGTSEERVTAIAPLPDGVVVGGDYDTSVTLFGDSLTNEGGLDAYVARLKDDGHTSTPVWVETWPGVGDDEVVALAARKATIGVGIQLSDVTTGCVVHALRPADGAAKWSNAPNFTGSITLLDLAVAPDETVVMVARLIGEATTPDARVITPGGMEDLLIVRLDQEGVPIMVAQYPTDQILDASIAVDDQGHLSLGGAFVGTLDLGDGHVLEAAATVGFVAKLDAETAPIWSHRFAPPGSAVGSSAVAAVDVTSDGRVLAVGSFTGEIDFELIQIAAKSGADFAGLAGFAMSLGP